MAYADVRCFSLLSLLPFHFSFFLPFYLFLTVSVPPSIEPHSWRQTSLRSVTMRSTPLNSKSLLWLYLFRFPPTQNSPPSFPGMCCAAGTVRLSRLQSRVPPRRRSPLPVPRLCQTSLMPKTRTLQRLENETRGVRGGGRGGEEDCCAGLLHAVRGNRIGCCTGAFRCALTRHETTYRLFVSFLCVSTSLLQQAPPSTSKSNDQTCVQFRVLACLGTCVVGLVLRLTCARHTAHHTARRYGALGRRSRQGRRL